MQIWLLIFYFSYLTLAHVLSPECEASKLRCEYLCQLNMGDCHRCLSNYEWSRCCLMLGWCDDYKYMLFGNYHIEVQPNYRYKINAIGQLMTENLEDYRISIVPNFCHTYNFSIDYYVCYFYHETYICECIDDFLDMNKYAFLHFVSWLLVLIIIVIIPTCVSSLVYAYARFLI